MTFGSLFAGVGGFDLGFERSGLRCVWQVELDEHARSILERHWPAVPRWGDIRTFSGWPAEVICGGFPCKQTSSAAAVHGRRSGLAGKDSGLWYEMLRIVRLVRPRWVVVENVVGTAKWLPEIKTGLEDAGYQLPCKPGYLSASSLGAPHQRRRLFVIANRDGTRLEMPWPSGSPETVGREGRAANGDAWLQTLTGVVRVDDGLSGGLDRRKRIERIGNAVCPLQAEWIGRRIMEAAS